MYIIKYIYEDFLKTSKGKPRWDLITCINAARGGHLDILCYLHERKCPWNIKVYSRAAENGHLPIIRYLVEHEGCSIKNCESLSWPNNTCSIAARRGHLSIVRYIYEKGLPCNGEEFFVAVLHGHLSIVKYLYKKGSWNEEACKYAARGNHLNILKYLVKKGAVFDEETYRYAVKNSNLFMIKYLDDLHCPHPNNIVEVAKRESLDEVVDYLLSCSY